MSDSATVESTSNDLTVTPLWFLVGFLLLPWALAGTFALFDKWRTWWMEKQIQHYSRGYQPRPRATHTKRRMP